MKQPNDFKTIYLSVNKEDSACSVPRSCIRAELYPASTLGTRDQLMHDVCQDVGH